MEDGFIGKRFNRWVVVNRGEDYIYPSTGKSSIRYNCLCDCGNTKLVHKSHLLNGSSQSCSCLNREISTTHGESQSREYNCWHNMKDRCYNKSNKSYADYGEKGITICSRWEDVTLFIKDMGRCPEGYELDRVDFTKGYYKENCRWVSEQVQAANRGKFKNNTSGETGVTLIRNYLKSGKENFYWRATKDTAKRRITKNFSINKLGYKEAFKRASEFRNEL